MPLWPSHCFKLCHVHVTCQRCHLGSELVFCEIPSLDCQSNVRYVCNVSRVFVFGVLMLVCFVFFATLANPPTPTDSRTDYRYHVPLYPCHVLLHLNHVPLHPNHVLLYPCRATFRYIQTMSRLVIAMPRLVTPKPCPVISKPRLVIPTPRPVVHVPHPVTLVSRAEIANKENCCCCSITCMFNACFCARIDTRSVLIVLLQQQQQQQ